MTRFFTLLATFALCLSASAAKINPSSRYVRAQANISSGNITAIVTNTSIDVEYTQASNRRIEIYGPDNLVPYVKVTRSTNGTLTVDWKESMNINGRFTIKVLVTAPSVTTFRTRSSGDITMANSLSMNSKLTFETNSSGDIKAKDVKCTDFNAITRSSGDISMLTVRCSSASLTTSSSGDIKANKVIARNTMRASTMSSGDISVSAVTASALEASSSSSGDIKINDTNCSTVSATVSSSGDITLLGIAATTVTASTGSSGDINLTGDCTEAQLYTNSSGDINARNLHAETVNARVTSRSSTITCYAIERLVSMGPKESIRCIGSPRTSDITTNR